MIETRCDVCHGLIEIHPHYKVELRYGKNLLKELDLCVPCYGRLNCGTFSITIWDENESQTRNET